MANQEFLEFKNIKFYFHPFSKYYLASRCGKILSLKRKEKKILKLNKKRDGYLDFCFYENNKRKKYYVHRFVYETFKGEIPKGKVIDHCDNDSKNNFINNLQLLTQKENVRKSCCKKVISLNIETREKKIFSSITKAAEYHQIFFSTVSMICRKINKSCKSKKDGQCYQFFYFKN